ncbi:MAG TPA: phospholipase D family protein, partial [Burkholderiales bacterium]
TMQADATPSLRPQTLTPRALRWISLLLLLAVLGVTGGCAGLPPGADLPKTQSVALEHPEETKLGKQFADASQAHGGQSAFRLVPAGIDGFLLRAQMMDAAQKTIDMQYYIFRADETGKLLIDAILRAADRGVRVRLLIDDIDNVGEDAQVEALDAHPNIEVRLFNPLRYRGDSKIIRGAEILLWLRRLDYRMHNKLMVVDNAVCLVGGRNIGDAYFQVDPDGQQGDFETFAGGPIVAKLSSTFDLFWKSTPAIPVKALSPYSDDAKMLATYRAALREHRQDKKDDGSDYYSRIGSGEPLRGMLDGRIPLAWANAQVEFDSPDKREIAQKDERGRLLSRAIDRAFAEAREKITMVSAYFVPGEDGMRLLEDQHERGVEVRLLTNSLPANNEPAAAAGYLHYRKRVLNDGFDLYEERARPGSPRGTHQPVWLSSYGNFGLHTKLYMFDDDRIFVGSMNFDQRSRHLNTELGLLIESHDLATQGLRFFDALAAPENSYHVTLEKAPGTDGKRIAWHTKENGQALTLYKEPAKDDWQRMKVELLSLLPFDHEL